MQISINSYVWIKSNERAKTCKSRPNSTAVSTDMQLSISVRNCSEAGEALWRENAPCQSASSAGVTSLRVEGEETDWPALWGAASSGRSPKDTRWPRPAPTWWGAHSVCRRSSPSPTLRPEPRPSWVTWSCVLPATHKCTQPKAIYDPGVRMKPGRNKKKKKESEDEEKTWLSNSSVKLFFLFVCFKAPSGSASPLVLWLRQSALS